MFCFPHLTRHFSHPFFLLSTPGLRPQLLGKRGEDPLGGEESGEGHGTHIWGSGERRGGSGWASHPGAEALREEEAGLTAAQTVAPNRHSVDQEGSRRQKWEGGRAPSI